MCQTPKTTSKTKHGVAASRFSPCLYIGFFCAFAAKCFFDKIRRDRNLIFHAGGFCEAQFSPFAETELFAFAQTRRLYFSFPCSLLSPVTLYKFFPARDFECFNAAFLLKRPFISHIKRQVLRKNIVCIQIYE